MPEVLQFPLGGSVFFSLQIIPIISIMITGKITCDKLTIVQPPVPVSQHSTATLITPSLLFSNNSYASSILFNGYVCVISGSVLILPSDISFRISSQSQPSTPPV